VCLAMRIGLNASSLVVMGATVDQYVEHAAQAEADGFSSWWMAQLGAPDALTALGAVGRGTESIELGTAVVPTWFRHPLMLAAQALTTQEMAGGRLVPISPRSRRPCASPSSGRPGTWTTTSPSSSPPSPTGG
jgi:5,10-methylenetetrahydromethanopterin reductase